MATVKDRVDALKITASQLLATASSQALMIASLTEQVEALEEAASNPPPAPTIYFASATVSASEGDSGTKNLQLTAKRSTTVGAVAATAVFIQGSAGPADFGGNTLPGDKTFTFADGSDTATQPVTISGDTDVESDETFGYQLVAPNGYALGTPASVTGTILNDDAGVAPAPTTTNGIVNDGDSITEGPNYIPVRPPRPEMLANLTGLMTTNIGVSSRKLQEMDSTFGSRGVAALFNASNRNTISLLAGINDIGAGATLAQLQGYMTSYVGKARAAGFRVILGTVLPSIYSDGTKEQVRTGFNTWLRQNLATIGAQALADYDAIPAAADPNNTLYYVDGLHPSPRLLAKMAVVEAAAMGLPIVQFNPNPRISDTANIGGYVGVTYDTTYSIFDRGNQQLSFNGNRLRITATPEWWYPEADIEVNGLVVNQNYRLTYDVVAFSTVPSGAGVSARVTKNVGDKFDVAPAFPAASPALGTRTYDFTATQTTMAIALQFYIEGADAFAEFDNITLTPR